MRSIKLNRQLLLIVTLVYKNVHCSGTYKRSHEELDKDSGPGVKPPFFSVTPIG